MNDCHHMWCGDSCHRCHRKMCELFPVPPGTEGPYGTWAVTDRGEWEQLSDDDVEAELDKEADLDDPKHPIGAYWSRKLADELEATLKDQPEDWSDRFD